MKLCVVPVHNLLTAALTAGSVCALAAGILTPAALAQTATARATIAGTHPTWANESRRVAVAPVASGTVSARVYLAGQDPEGGWGVSGKMTWGFAIFAAKGTPRRNSITFSSQLITECYFVFGTWSGGTSM